MSSNSRDSAAQAVLIAALARVASGDQVALRNIFDLTSAKLFGACLRICRERQAAEDVLQEVYVTVWTRAGSFDPARASPITWLATIARNRAIDWLRSQRHAVTGPIEAAEAIPDSAPLASDIIEQRDDTTRLHACLGELEAQSSQAIRSAFLDGLTYVELADRASVPLGTMKSWIRRGLQRLKACLGDD